MRVLPILLLCACAEQQPYDTFEMQANPPTPIDVLVVLDDTTAMADHLPRRGADQIGILSLIYNGAPDIRVAMTTGTTGTLRTSPAVPAGFIEHRIDLADGQLKTNYSGDLQTAIASLTNVGASKTDPNALLASTQHALETPGFLRDGVGTGMIMLTATDDASTGDPATYANAILAHHSRAMVSVVNADPAPRLGAFADALPFRSFWPMATYDMSALTVLAQLWKPENYDYCLPIRPALVNGDYDCDIVTEYQHITMAQPRCDGEFISTWDSDQTCWQVLPEASCGSGLALVLGGPFHHYHPRVIGRCAVD